MAHTSIAPSFDAGDEGEEEREKDYDAYWQHVHCKPRERRPTLGHHWFIQRAVGAAAAHPPKVEGEAAAGMTVPPRRQEVADLGQGPTVRVEGAPRPSQMGVAPGAHRRRWDRL